MPITTVGSYPPVMQEFINHWTAVNAAINPDVLTLAGGFTLANFTSERAGIVAAITAVEPADNTREAAGEDRDLKKAALRLRLSQLRAAVATLFPGTIYAKMIPNLPGFGGVESRFLRPFDDAANAWSRINTDTIAGFTPPLLLAGGYTLATFNTDLAALRTAYIAYTNAAQNSSAARASRDALLAPARQRMKEYRQAVKFKLMPDNALLATVPILTPPPGSTPQPVNVSVVWNPATSKADLSWTASDNANLDHYSVRTAPGPVYKTADESVVAEVAKTLTAYSTDAGLLAAGATALFRVYVVLTTANEKGSTTLSVTHPEV